MQLTVQLVGTESVRVFGRCLTPSAPSFTVPFTILEHVRIYSKANHFLNFGEVSVLLDKGMIKLIIPPAREITTSAQLRALEVRGDVTFETTSGTPIGYRGGIEFGPGFSVTEDPANNTVQVDVAGGIVEYGPPISTAQTNVEGVETKVSRADHQHRTGLEVQGEGATVGTRPTLDFQGAVTVTDNAGSDKVEVHIDAGGLRKQAFTAGDWGAGFVDISTPVPAGATIEEVSLHVVTAFDNASQARVGDAGNNSRLLHEFDSDLAELDNTYKSTSNYTYVASTQLRVYFVGGPPSVGNGVVYVYFSTE